MTHQECRELYYEYLVDILNDLLTIRYTHEYDNKARILIFTTKHHPDGRDHLADWISIPQIDITTETTTINSIASNLTLLDIQRPA